MGLLRVKSFIIAQTSIPTLALFDKDPTRMDAPFFPGTLVLPFYDFL
jgi:hypothetical protein